MIDLHCQLLGETGRDCREDAGDALEICRRALEEGVHTIVATGTCGPRAPEPELTAEYRRRLERLKEGTGGSLRLKLGFVVKFSADLASLVGEHGSQLGLGGGRFVLVSLPPLRTPPEAEEVWRSVAELGFNVILARPECSPALRRDPARLDGWVRRGVMLQLDAASVTGAHGRVSQHFALLWAQRYVGRVAVASNARAGQSRPSFLGLARQELARRFGPACAQTLLSDTPAAVINGEMNGPLADGAHTPRSSLISRFRSYRLQKGFSSAS
jgi:protein-tyrosine phosphatase